MLDFIGTLRGTTTLKLISFLHGNLLQQIVLLLAPAQVQHLPDEEERDLPAPNLALLLFRSDFQN